MHPTNQPYWLLLLFLTFLTNTIAGAQSNISVETEMGKGVTHIVYRLTVSPSEVPSPILKYRLDIPSIEMQPGNPIPFYLRPLGENTFEKLWEPLKNVQTKERCFLYHNLSNNLSDFPNDSLQRFSRRSDQFVENFLSKAAYQSRPDWGFYPAQFKGGEFASILMPAIQHSRQIGRAICIRTRIANRERDFDKSIELMTYNLKLSEDIKQSPFLVAQLVGISCQNITYDCFLEFISQEDAPNLYFALAAKRPMKQNLKHCFQLESQWPLTIDPVLESLEDQDFTASQWNKKYHNIYRKFQKILINIAWENPTPVKMSSADFAKTCFPGAKRRLQKRGFSKDSVESMPVGKVLLFDLVHDLKHYLQQQELFAYLPEPKRSQLMDKLQLEIKNSAGQTRLGAIIAQQLHQGFQNTSAVAERAEWQMKSLQVIESLRLYAKQNGRFPQNLNQLKWPAPKNPITGEPFDYQLKGQTAIITLASNANREVGTRLEIKLAKIDNKN